jgi:hypothetical protein
MAELERCYVIDIAVPKEEFRAACSAFADIFGIEPVHTGAVHSTHGDTDMMHFAVGGLNALGVMTVLRPPAEAAGDGMTGQMAEYLERHRAGGVYLLGHLVDDIDGYLAILKGNDIPMVTPEPRPYPDGRLIATDFVQGTIWEFGQHKGAEVTGDWSGLRAAAADITIERAYRVDVVVRDLDRAIEDVRRITGREPGPRAGIDDDGAIKGVDFPIKGLAATGLVSLDGTPKGAFSQAVADHLEQYGEGAMSIGFHVGDMAKARARIEEAGATFQYAQDQPSAEGLTNITSPIHGVIVQYTQP